MSLLDNFEIGWPYLSKFAISVCNIENHYCSRRCKITVPKGMFMLFFWQLQMIGGKKDKNEDGDARSKVSILSYYHCLIQENT